MDFDKASPSASLTNQLRGMDPQATVRVIVTIGDGTVGRPLARTIDPMAAHLAGLPRSRPLGMPTSRADNRRALIESQTSANTAATASVRAEIESLGLQVRGGTLMPVFVVEGLPNVIERVLAINGVSSVELDQAVSVNPTPIQP